MRTQQNRGALSISLPGRNPLETHPYPMEMKNRAARLAELLEVRLEAPGEAPDLPRNQREFYQLHTPWNRTPLLVGR
jgi:hypothetical protein